MKKTYEAPTVERVEFKYRDQVVAASAGCGIQYVNLGTLTTKCPDDQQVAIEYLK